MDIPQVNLVVPSLTAESLGKAVGPIPLRLRDEFIGYMTHAYNDDDAPDGAWFAAMENDALDFMVEHKLKGDENDAVHQLLDWLQPSEPPKDSPLSGE